MLAPARERRRECRSQDSKSTNETAALSRNGPILPTAAGTREAGKPARRLTRVGKKLEAKLRADIPCMHNASFRNVVGTADDRPAVGEHSDPILLNF